MAPAFCPTYITDIELGDAPRPPLCVPPRYRTVRALVRLLRTPVGMVEMSIDGGRVDPATLCSVARTTFAPEILQLCATAGVVVPPGSSLWESLGGVPKRFESSDGMPFVSVAISTRERPDRLVSTLRSLQRSVHPNFEVVVIDNAPTTDRTLRLVKDEFGDDARFRYVVEPVPGLSNGRNAALVECASDIVAFTDDDVIVDPYWLSALTEAFGDDEQVACVTGLVATAELETVAQAHFDTKVGWGDVRERVRYTRDMDPKPLPSYPYSAGYFGTGANFAVRRRTIMDLGGFDPVLGAGSPTRGGEDLDIFLRVIQSGHALVYEPASVAWHFHRVEPEHLRKQMFAYGLGFTAYATKCLTDPSQAREIVRIFPRAARMLGRARAQDVSHQIPLSLLAIEFAGMVCGPAHYLSARRRRNASSPSVTTPARTLAGRPAK